MTGRVAILSDLHCDSYARAGRDPVGAHGLDSIIDGSLDAVIIAGDLTNGPPRRWGRALALLTRYVAPGKIYLLPGNHDYYNGALTDDPLLEAQARSAGAHFIQKSQLYHGDTRFLCCTLWTDFDLLGDAGEAMRVAQRVMNDYEKIWKSSFAPCSEEVELGWGSVARLIDPTDILALHQDHRAWLTESLNDPHRFDEGGRTVIVTHHGPHEAVAGPLDSLTPAFHSDMSDMIERFNPNAWFFGHSHRRLRATVGGTDIRNVSVGYPDEVGRQEAGDLFDACLWES
ncbi:metallophosphoesterase [Thalassorhabdomicrobium marinisediminis]|uniref:Metallophosphoesterase n=1 Tax=Thalassorhabdomicrobium marinisediminis TaxID=2170577 RepID=A0A2T7FWR3_9RHOB|nr:metallophosphoesterase [Thalassorhabdomicrobium marinisediminis]